MTRRLRLGARGRWLFSGGALYLLLGLQYALQPVPPERQRALAAALYLAPMWVWATAWMLAGSTAVVCGFMHWWRLGFGALYAMPAVWAACFMATWMAGRFGVLHPASAGAGTGAVIFALLALWVYQTVDVFTEKRPDVA